MSGTFQSNISLNYVLNLVWKIYIGLLKIKPALFGGFLGHRHVGNCKQRTILFFNALIQSLSNVYNIHRLLREHVHTLEEDEGKYFTFYKNILGK